MLILIPILIQNKNVLQLKATATCFDLVDCCDLDLDPLTFTSELDLDMIVTYLYATKIRSISQAVQKLSSGKENETFGCCDLDLDPITFTSELDVDMVVTNLHAKN